MVGKVGSLTDSEQKWTSGKCRSRRMQNRVQQADGDLMDAGQCQITKARERETNSH